MLKHLVLVALLAVLVPSTLGESDGSLATGGGAQVHASPTPLDKLRQKVKELNKTSGEMKQNKENLKGRFPYVVSLQDPNREHQCGAVLIRLRWILTAAQCVSPFVNGSMHTGNFVINIGGFDAGDPLGQLGEVMFPVQTIIHQGFDGNSQHGFDIALVQLPEDSQIKPARVPHPTWKVDIDSELVTLGWGSGDAVSTTMQNTLTTSLSMEECNHPLKGWNKKATSSMICASGPPSGFCKGEPGTPLILPDSPKKLDKGNPTFDLVVGISSFGENACRKNGRPGVFTRVSSFADWINETIENIEAGLPVDQPQPLLPMRPPALQSEAPSGPPMQETAVPPTTPPHVARKSSANEELQDRFSFASSLRDADHNHQCGGALIRARWILTAAQCVSPLVKGSLGVDHFIIDIGGFDAGSPTGRLGEETFPLQTVVHPKFDGKSQNGYDIALIYLPNASQQKPLRVPQPTSTTSEGTKLVTLGWGTGENLSVNMQNAFMTSLSLKTCNRPNEGWNGRAKSSMLCAADSSSGFCRGEAGTPLIFPDSPSHLERGNPSFDIVVGISSFGEKTCKEDGKPAVFTCVSDFSDWIEKTIKSVEAGLPVQPEASDVDISSSSMEGPPASRPAPLGATTESALESRPSTRREGPKEESTMPAKTPTHASPRCTTGCKELDEMLRSSAESGKASEVKKLLMQGARLESTGADQKTALYLATENGHASVVKILVEAGANLEAQERRNGYTSLTINAKRGYPNVVGILIEAGADLNHREYDGETPLIWASKKGHLDIMAALITAGASVNDADTNGETALIWASLTGRVDAVNALVEAGANVNHQDHDDDTALIYASWNGHLEVVIALIEAGAAVDVKNVYGWTGLIQGAYYGHTEIVRVLLEAGAAKDLKDGYGETALSKAQDKGHTEIIALLTKGP